MTNRKQEIIKLLNEKFSHKEEFSKSYYSQNVALWEKDGKARLYVPRNAYEQAGYINLIETQYEKKGDMKATRPGNAITLKEVFETELFQELLAMY